MEDVIPSHNDVDEESLSLLERFNMFGSGITWDLCMGRIHDVAKSSDTEFATPSLFHSGHILGIVYG